MGNGNYQNPKTVNEIKRDLWNAGFSYSGEESYENLDGKIKGEGKNVYVDLDDLKTFFEVTGREFPEDLKYFVNKLNDTWSNNKANGMNGDLLAAESINANLDNALVNTAYWAFSLEQDVARLNDSLESDGLSLSDVNEIAISTGRTNIRERGSDQIGSAQQMLQRIEKLEKRTILIGGERESAIDLASEDVQLEIEAMKNFLNTEQAKGLKGKELEQAWEEYRSISLDINQDIEVQNAVNEEVIVTAERVTDKEAANANPTTSSSGESYTEVNPRFDQETWQIQNSLADAGLGDMLGDFPSVDPNGKNTGQNTGLDGIEGPMTRAAILESKKRLNNLFKDTDIAFDENSEVTEEYLNTITNFSKLKNASELIAKGELDEKEQKEILKNLEAQYKNSKLAGVLKGQGIDPFDTDGLDQDEINKMSALAANFGKGGNGMSVAG